MWVDKLSAHNVQYSSFTGLFKSCGLDYMAEKISKLNMWFKHFTNDGCSTTFLNRTESARRAGYKTKNEDSLAQIGCQNFRKLNDKIEKWLNEAGLSENALRLKMLSLLEADETKLITIKGEIDEETLPPGTSLLSSSKQKKLNASGEEYTEINNIIAVAMAAKETQRRTLEMAMKVKGMFQKDNEQKKPNVDVKTENKLERSESEKEQLSRLVDAVESVLMGRS